MPWKNGGGETAEIAVSPEGAALDAFDWRISMARVDGDGPFSRFADVDRTLLVLDGAGLILRVAGQEAVTLTSESAPYPFPADRDTSATLLNGPIVDFNVMTHRGRIAQRVRRMALTGPVDQGGDALATLVFCVDGHVEVRSATANSRLGARDGVLLGVPDGSTRLDAAPSATVIVVEISAR